MLASNELTVVVQGPVFGSGAEPAEERLTERAIQSIRRNLPGAEVVLSTWEGADVRGLAPDVTLFNRDPGVFVHQFKKSRLDNNVNRQIVSTLAGIRAATRPHVLKLRSDCEINHPGFLRYWKKYQERAPELTVFENRIVSGELFARDPVLVSYLYHPSDVFHFGTQGDMLRLWDIPLAPAAETVAWREKCENRPWYDKRWQTVRYVPEQYLWIAALRKAGYSDALDYCQQMSRPMLQRSELSIVNNFAIIPERSLGLVVPPRFGRLGSRETYSHAIWRRLLKIHVESHDAKAIAKRIQMILKIDRFKLFKHVRATLVNHAHGYIHAALGRTAKKPSPLDWYEQ